MAAPIPNAAPGDRRTGEELDAPPAPSTADEATTSSTAPAEGNGRWDGIATGPWLDRAIVLAAFAVSRIGYALAGVRFDSSSLDFASQLLDPTLLRDRTIESVWYLHSQPPAFNLFVGLGLRLSPFSPGTTFHLAYLALGVTLALSLLALGRRLRLGRRTAIVVAVVISCLPAVVLYENWLSYEYPVAVLLVVLVLLVARYGRRPSPGRLAAATAAAAVAVLTRSLLHPAWLVGVFAVLVLFRRPIDRRVALVGAAPLLVVLLVLAKNQVLFGSPQLSSWFGYNVHKVVVDPLTDDQRRILGEEGFERSEPGPCTIAHPDVPAVADELKREWRGEGDAPIENFNYECVIPRYAALGDDSLVVVRAHPTWVARNVGGAAEIWASPSSVTPFVFDNRNEIGPLDDLVRRTLLLDVGWDPVIAIPQAWPVQVSAPDHRFHLSLTIVLATAIVGVAAIAALFRWRRRTPVTLTVLVGGTTVVFVTLASIALEYGENNRIRFVVEPLTYLLAAAVIAQAIRMWRARRA